LSNCKGYFLKSIILLTIEIIYIMRYNKSMNTVLGILAHVDAGKTTLSEALLYRSGVMRTLGRVDSKNTVMDTHELERARGITIFSSEAAFNVDGADFTLLDTPGHVDFSAETERTLSVLDYAILVISGTDGVQAHTRTLWKLIEMYRIPTLIFVTKMDFARIEKGSLIEELKKELSPACCEYDTDDFFESASLADDTLVEKYLESGVLDKEDIRRSVKSRAVFPVFFGSGLKLSGVDEFLQALKEVTCPQKYRDEFGARVYKISRTANGEKLTHVKITGGRLSVRDEINGQKVSGIRIYSGAKFESRDFAEAGSICALTGLANSVGGEGLGFEKDSVTPYLEPVMNYSVILEEGTDPQTVLPKLKLLQEEDPQLKFSWNQYLQQIHVSLMGKVQTEILKSIVSDRFGINIGIGKGSVVYKETVSGLTEGVGHYEPLRHYAEVHLLIEPRERGAGNLFTANVREDTLDRNWQRLIMGHMSEKEHVGVLTGSPITDVKITLAAGRAHLKHTEGGDFRQATYRAIRQGLMKAESVLLEPYYAFRLEVPTAEIGRAINDIRARSGEFSSPEDAGDTYILTGRAPVVTMEDYSAEVAAYTGGRGRLSLTVSGYDVCHNADEVIKDIGYIAESDIDNTPDSVFCAHGAGFNVKWSDVEEYMHLESCLQKPTETEAPKVKYRNLNIDDKELEKIMEREFGPIRRREYGIAKVHTVDHDVKTTAPERKKTLIVDGYNVIFAWDELTSLAAHDLESARIKLVDILVNYSAFTNTDTVVVFDAYRVENGGGERYTKNKVRVVFTKENETGDAYIEKLVASIGKNDNVSVVTSDGLIQLSAVRAGVLRISAREFEKDVDRVYMQISDTIEKINKVKPITIKDKME